MKHIFTVSEIAQGTWAESVPETTEVLLTGQPFDDRVRVFVPLGYLTKSEDLADKIGEAIRGRRWGILTRNDGHYMEIETEDHEGEPDAQSTP